MMSTKSNDGMKREWFDLSNRGDVKKMIGVDIQDSELLPKLCNCEICSDHYCQFDYFKTFITEKFPEYITLRYFVYYYFTKSMADQSLVLSKEALQGNNLRWKF